MTEMLVQFDERYPDFQNRIKALNLWRVGTPYGELMLGENKEPDPDPIIRTDVSDCTVHVLTTLAMARSTSWDEALNSMIDIHYKKDLSGKPVVDFSTRWHFTLDRILSNPFTENITYAVADSNVLAPLNITLNRKTDGSEFLSLNWEQPVATHYIDRGHVNKALLSKLPDVVGIAFVKKAFFKNGIAIGHEGILIDQTELVHASSDSGKTVKVDFLEYFGEDSGRAFDGIMIYKFNQF
jgi:hypothetical protein